MWVRNRNDAVNFENRARNGPVEEAIAHTLMYPKEHPYFCQGYRIATQIFSGAC
jgi:hypothetical protein